MWGGFVCVVMAVVPLFFTEFWAARFGPMTNWQNLVWMIACMGWARAFVAVSMVEKLEKRIVAAGIHLRTEL